MTSMIALPATVLGRVNLILTTLYITIIIVDGACRLMNDGTALLECTRLRHCPVVGFELVIVIQSALPLLPIMYCLHASWTYHEHDTTEQLVPVFTQSMPSLLLHEDLNLHE